jgi:hypothetical protein
MTQFQLDMICRIIEVGAPALAAELCSVLDSFVKDRNALAAENKQLKAQIAGITTEPAAEEATE